MNTKYVYDQMEKHYYYYTAALLFFNILIYHLRRKNDHLRQIYWLLQG